MGLGCNVGVAALELSKAEEDVTLQDGIMVPVKLCTPGTAALELTPVVGADTELAEVTTEIGLGFTIGCDAVDIHEGATVLIIDCVVLIIDIVGQ
jgi:hypothetical protein